MFRKVVIVDDDEVSIFLTETMLSVYGFGEEYKTFLNAPQALSYLTSIFEGQSTEQLPDVIFLDLNMPFMSGWDFLNELRPRAEQLKACCKIFILTSSVDKEEMECAKKYSFVQEFLHKPLEENEVLRLLKKPGTNP
ncbi:response regulator [Pontibacter oryzae]|uniref:Response regulator n=1 Tax=Pontibacter oryzae TaxID=2304593 RepID=A0A399SH33_9BACT|nr:response regulator [Pontibacter oryzae]RIJ42411.1 response regulator [Pontibacter oryzae]